LGSGLCVKVETSIIREKGKKEGREGAGEISAKGGKSVYLPPLAFCFFAMALVRRVKLPHYPS